MTYSELIERKKEIADARARLDKQEQEIDARLEKAKLSQAEKLLKEVCRRTAEAGYRLGNCDITILAQRPKLMPFIPRMRIRLSEVIGTEPGRISVKATTEEGLGFTGAGEGIAAHAVVLLEERGGIRFL